VSPVATAAVVAVVEEDRALLVDVRLPNPEHRRPERLLADPLPAPETASQFRAVQYASTRFRTVQYGLDRVRTVGPGLNCSKLISTARAGNRRVWP
jgi:hypothetical protein